MKVIFTNPFLWDETYQQEEFANMKSLENWNGITKIGLVGG